MDKYYAPSLEDFYWGFEFEVLNESKYYDPTILEGAWLPASMGFGIFGDIENIHKLLNDKQLRVKYLDKEDIEALGWVPDAAINDWTFRYVKGGNDLTGWFHKDMIAISISNELDNTIFCGKIKNASESKKLMEQLTITTP